MRTLEALLKEGTEILEKAKIEEARPDAWLLLEYTAGISRAWYYAHRDAAADPSAEEAYAELIARRARHIPLQHLTHQAFFMGHEFYVDEHVLIPRQDTEVLVEEALKCMDGIQKPEILDMCTGSGCILLSLLAEKQEGTGVGADLSPDALAVAGRNAKSLGLSERAEFVESDLFSADYFAQRYGKDTGKYDILISNPPYIPTEEIRGLMAEVRLHDPILALDGKADGLYFYRKITERAGAYLKPGGWLLYEIGCDQGPDVAQMLQQAGFAGIKICRDLAGLDRVVLGRMPE